MSTEIENLLAKHLGEEFDMTPDEAFHEDGFRFWSDSQLNPSFRSFTDKPLCEANLLLGEMDDDKKHRVERLGDYLIYTFTEHYKGEVTGVYGQILKCATGSVAEAIFMEKLAQSMVRDAIEPMQAVVKALGQVGLAARVQALAAEALQA